MPVLQWMHRGMFACMLLAVMAHCAAALYGYMRYCVHGLPQGMLAWVPGIDMMWCLGGIYCMGRILTLPRIDSYMVGIYHWLHKQCLLGMYGTSELTRVGFPWGEDTMLRCGYMLQCRRIQGKAWAIVVATGGWGLGTKYLVPLASLVHLEDRPLPACWDDGILQETIHNDKDTAL